MTFYDLVSALDSSTSVTLYTRIQVGNCMIAMHSQPLNANELEHMCRVSNKVSDVKIHTLKADGDKIYVGVKFINE